MNSNIAKSGIYDVIAFLYPAFLLMILIQNIMLINSYVKTWV